MFGANSIPNPFNILYTDAPQATYKVIKKPRKTETSLLRRPYPLHLIVLLLCTSILPTISISQTTNTFYSPRQVEIGRAHV